MLHLCIPGINASSVRSPHGWCACVACYVQQLGRIHAAAFSDTVLHSELLAKALFWQQNNFFNLDMTALHQPALEGYFAQVSHMQRSSWAHMYPTLFCISPAVLLVCDASCAVGVAAWIYHAKASLQNARPCDREGKAERVDQEGVTPEALVCS